MRVAVGLGSNLGRRREFLAHAALALSEDLLEDAVCSSVYESPPWGKTDQPHFLNAVIVGDCEWKPPAIVSYLKQLETKMGRVASERLGPRIIDLDLLLYGEETWESDGVVVPHPGIPHRDFVLLPLLELWKDSRALKWWESFQKTHSSTATVIGPLLLSKENP